MGGRHCPGGTRAWLLVLALLAVGAPGLAAAASEKASSPVEVETTQWPPLESCLEAFGRNGTDFWNYTLPCANLTGLTCNGDGSVIAMNLSSQGLVGSVPSALGELTTLTLISLKNNSLSGSIPATLGSLQDLASLDLSMNTINGSFPSSFKLLRNLTNLVVANNTMKGHLLQLRYMSKLKSLNVANNQFYGPLPAYFSGLTHLTNLNAARNNLTNATALPRSLKNLNLGHNFLEMFTPAMLNLTKVFRMDLSFNKIGSIPDTISQLSSLSYLDLKSNQLFDVLPASVSALKELNFLDLSHNSNDLLLALLPQLPTSLKSLVLASNSYGGPVPVNLTTSTSLRQLDLSGNQITKGIQPILELKSLVGLNLAYCGFSNATGTPLDSFSALTELSSLIALDLSQNNFDSNITNSLSVLSNLAHLSLANCNLKGTMPAFLANFTNMNTLDLSYNQLNGTVLPALGSLPRLSSLLVSNVLLYCPTPANNPCDQQPLYLNNSFCTGVCPNYCASCAPPGPPSPNAATRGRQPGTIYLSLGPRIPVSVLASLVAAMILALLV